MRKTLLILAAATTLAASAQSQLANPKDSDGNIIFKYDMVNDRWADANDLRIDETFVFAIDITGVTDANGKVLTEEVAKTGRASIGRGIAFDCWVDQDNYPTGSKGPNFDGRMFKIKDNIWGTYLHGLFDSGELAQKLAALLCGRKGLSVEAAEAVSHAAYQQTQLDLLADGVRQALDMEKIYRIMEGS